MTNQPSNGLNIALWVVQALLTFAFGMSGMMKLMTPHEILAVDMTWVNMFSSAEIKTIGALEFIAGIGLILPSALRIMPKLTGFAALGLVATMIGAIATHVIEGQLALVPINIVLGLLAIFVAWGRLIKAPLHAKK